MRIWQQDSKNFSDPLFNRDKIGNRPIINVKVEREENLDINHRVRHIIKMMSNWIKKPFALDPIPKTVIFHAQACPAEGRGKKVTIYQLDRLIGYYRDQKGRGQGNRKISLPQRVEPKEGEIPTPT